MTSLALPRPDNMRGRFGRLIEHDVFAIAERIKELDPNLYIYELDPPVQLGDQTFNFAICEQCADGVERLVYRTEALDARIIERLEYMLRIPFEKRLDEAEKQEARAEAERKQNEHDVLYEKVGRPMLTDLERCGFITRPVSYPKRGVKPR